MAWNIGNTSVRNPWRIQNGLRLFAAEFSGNLDGKERERAFVERLVESGLVASEEPTDWHGRKFRSCFAKMGFATAKDDTYKKRGGDVTLARIRERLPELRGFPYELTPAGKRLLAAASQAAIGDAFLRQLIRLEIPSPIEKQRLAVGEMPEAKKKAFEDLLKSNEGGEILAEYLDTVLRTSSKTAIAALAILYADTDHKRYSPDFKLAAAIALEGISEQKVDAFLDLSQANDFIPANNQPNPPYPVAVANDKFIDALPTTAGLLRPPATRAAIISDLINRGLLLPDYASSRWGDGGVGLTFGVSDTTEKFARLLREARSILPAAQ